MTYTDDPIHYSAGFVVEFSLEMWQKTCHPSSKAWLTKAGLESLYFI